jgi:hypothetical protein
MDTLTFLQRVLPTGGRLVSIVINDGGTPRQAFFDTVEELADYCIASDTSGHNIYYAISSFIARGSRKQENVHKTKVLALDVDCAPGKPFLTQKDGIAALSKFLTDTGMPKPMIISSGRGLHVYWILDRALLPAERQPMAEGLKTMCVAHDFSVDNALTANSSLVLRPPGTRNPKNGKMVKLLMDAPDIPVADMQKIMRNVTPSSAIIESPTQQNTLPPVRPSIPPNLTPNVPPRSAASAQLSANMSATQSQLPPADPQRVYDDCLQIRWAVDNQDKVPEPMWYDLIGVASYCVDREGTAKKWSKNYPGYSEVDTLKKLAQWKSQATGPATCHKIEVDSPKKCTDCKLKGNISSPAMIGLAHQDVGLATDAPDEIAKLVPLPKSFKRAGHGIVQTINGTDVDVCPFDLYATGYGMDEDLGYETVRYKWNRQHIGWTDLSFRQAHLTSGSREFPTTIADQGIVLSGKKKTEGFQVLLRSYMDNLRVVRTMTDIHNSMGWKNDNKSFVVGETVYKKGADGTLTEESVALQSGANRIGRMYGQAGTLEAWRDATAILEQHKLYGHMFSLGQGFAAPLWEFGGLRGITISFCGDTGTGKTLAQLLTQSIWGDPQQLHFASKYTANALFNRLGLYRHLPMTIDETTLMPDDEVGGFCFLVTQGRDKARLNRAAEEKAIKEWATVVTMSTNTPLMVKLAASGSASDAQMARLIELPLYPHKLFSKTSKGGKLIYRHLEQNYGVVGHHFAKALLKLGEVEIRRRLDECADTFIVAYGFTFTGEERYWEYAIVRYIVGCQIAKENNLIAFDYTLCVHWVLSQLEKLRATIADNHTNGWAMIHDYINEAAATILVVMHTANMPSHVDMNRHMSNEIYGRFDLYRKTNVDPFVAGTISLNIAKFRRWVSVHGYDYNTLMSEVRGVGADRSTSKRVWMGKDTDKKAGQHKAVTIDLACPEMQGYLDNGGFIIPALAVV